MLCEASKTNRMRVNGGGFSSSSCNCPKTKGKQRNKRIKLISTFNFKAISDFETKSIYERSLSAGIIPMQNIFKSIAIG